jgi:hypothetical protein
MYAPRLAGSIGSSPSGAGHPSLRLKRVRNGSRPIMTRLSPQARAGTLDAKTIAKIEADARVWREGDKTELHELMAFLADSLKGN